MRSDAGTASHRYRRATSLGRAINLNRVPLTIVAVIIVSIAVWFSDGQRVPLTIPMMQITTPGHP